MTTLKIPIAPRLELRWLERELPNEEDQRDYAQERAIVGVTESVVCAMDEAGLNQTEIAARIGKSRGHVSRLLDGTRNMTLRSLADMLWACGKEVSDLRLSPLGVSFLPADMLDTDSAQVASSGQGDAESTHSPVLEVDARAVSVA